jgi:iron(III) transport system permease protein
MSKKHNFSLRLNTSATKVPLGTLLLGFIIFIFFCLLALPLLVVIKTAFQTDQEVLDHLRQYLLPQLLSQTFFLTMNVSIGVSVLGLSLGWLIGQRQFVGKKILEWVLVLPLAIPGYIMAYAWLGLVDFDSPFTQWLQSLGLQGFISLRNLWGTSFILILTLYPYVYLTSKAAFAHQSLSLDRAAQSLGHGQVSRLRKVSFPLAIPAFLAGLTLCIMETLADFGTAAILGYDTITTGIYRTWFSLFSLETACQLATLLLFFVLGLLYLSEKLKQKNISNAKDQKRIEAKQLNFFQTCLALFYCGTIATIAFFLPLTQLFIWVYQGITTGLNIRYLDYLYHSLVLAGIGATAISVLALFFNLAQRNLPRLTWPLKLIQLGYATPGTVLAVGVIIPIAWLDNQIYNIIPNQIGLSGTILITLYALSCRFLSVGFEPIYGGLKQIPLSIDQASASLGASYLKSLTQIYLPILKPFILTSFLFSFVEIIKELPMTLMTRPFGWDTLSIRIFELTSEGQWIEAALPAATIVLSSLLPIILLMKQMQHVKN